jgi:hypothetical protein
MIYTLVDGDSVSQHDKRRGRVPYSHALARTCTGIRGEFIAHVLGSKSINIELGDGHDSDWAKSLLLDRIGLAGVLCVKTKVLQEPYDAHGSGLSRYVHGTNVAYPGTVEGRIVPIIPEDGDKRSAIRLVFKENDTERLFYKPQSFISVVERFAKIYLAQLA